MGILNKNDLYVITNKPAAHLHINNAMTPFTIANPNTWEKIDFSSGNPSIEGTGGFTWDAINEWFVWDEAEVLFPLTAIFIGDAQLQITSSISGALVVELGLVLNPDINPPNTTPPILITPTTYTQQSKISSYGANDRFYQWTSPDTGDSRLQKGDRFDIWIRCTDATATPTIQVDGFNAVAQGV